MSLPGLMIDAEKYQYYSEVNYKMIPFSDWFPPDFADVLCDIGGELRIMYYSPARNCMVLNEGLSAGESVNSNLLTYWLKKL